MQRHTWLATASLRELLRLPQRLRAVLASQQTACRPSNCWTSSPLAAPGSAAASAANVAAACNATPCSSQQGQTEPCPFLMPTEIHTHSTRSKPRKLAQCIFKDQGSSLGQCADLTDHSPPCSCNHAVQTASVAGEASDPCDPCRSLSLLLQSTCQLPG